jgi:hypothetical protein
MNDRGLILRRICEGIFRLIRNSAPLNLANIDSLAL